MQALCFTQFTPNPFRLHSLIPGRKTLPIDAIQEAAKPDVREFER